MANLQANYRGSAPAPTLQTPERTPTQAAVGAPRRPQSGRSVPVQLRLAPEELAVVQRAAREWAREYGKPTRRRKPAPDGKPRRRYSAVPRYIRAVVLAAAADPSAAPAGEAAPAEVYPATALRLEVRRVGQLLNQAIRLAHQRRKAGHEPDVVPLEARVEDVARVLHQVLAEVKGR